MRYATVCSGIEAPTIAWHGLGWEPVWFSEIEPFPCAVLAHYYPHVPNLGDMTKIHEDERYQRIRGAIGLLCGGTPCQSFSVAGLRKGMADPRGNLALHFLRIADEVRPRWFVWENVPGVLSSNGGRDFGSFLGALGQLGYGFAYRVLDAQFFGVPQRRRRVFVVGYIGGWRGAAAVLFDTESLRGNPPPGRGEGEGTAGRVAHSLDTRCGEATGRSAEQGHGLIAVAQCAGDFKARSEQQADSGKLVVTYVPQGHEGKIIPGDVCNPIRTNTARADERNSPAYVIKGAAIGRKLENGPQYGEVLEDGSCYTLNCTEQHAVVFQSGSSAASSMNPSSDVSPTLDVGKAGKMAVYGCGVDTTGHQGDKVVGGGDTSPCVPANGGNNGGGGGVILHHLGQVRRLTPRECERLQGFPDNFTRIPYRGKPASQCPDDPRYKALGNSMAVPVMRWIGERIQAYEDLKL